MSLQQPTIVRSGSGSTPHCYCRQTLCLSVPDFVIRIGGHERPCAVLVLAVILNPLAKRDAERGEHRSGGDASDIPMVAGGALELS